MNPEATLSSSPHRRCVQCLFGLFLALARRPFLDTISLGLEFTFRSLVTAVLIYLFIDSRKGDVYIYPKTRWKSRSV